MYLCVSVLVCSVVVELVVSIVHPLLGLMAVCCPHLMPVVCSPVPTHADHSTEQEDQGEGTQ